LEGYGVFRDRKEAGQKLGARLARYAGEHPLVLGVPRGGVVVAHEVARALNADLDIILARKLGAPHNRELAVGAVGPGGRVVFNWSLMESLGLSPQDLEEERQAQTGEIQRQMKTYRGGRPEINPADRVVIVVDDGLATGFTVQAALMSLADKNPRQIILAVPVAPRETLETMARLVDAVEALLTPEEFYAVGQFYHNFTATADAEVISLLEE
jgi:predicted phosphoribosyltransferase